MNLNQTEYERRKIVWENTLAMLEKELRPGKPLMLVGKAGTGMCAATQEVAVAKGLKTHHLCCAWIDHCNDVESFFKKLPGNAVAVVDYIHYVDVNGWNDKFAGNRAEFNTILLYNMGNPDRHIVLVTYRPYSYKPITDRCNVIQWPDFHNPNL